LEALPRLTKVDVPNTLSPYTPLSQIVDLYTNKSAIIIDARNPGTKYLNLLRLLY
jgi:hypothetical protein